MLSFTLPCAYLLISLFILFLCSPFLISLPFPILSLQFPLVSTFLFCFCCFLLLILSSFIFLSTSLPLNLFLISVLISFTCLSRPPLPPPQGCSSPIVVKFADTQKDKEQRRLQQQLAQQMQQLNSATTWGSLTGLGGLTPQYLAVRRAAVTPTSTSSTPYCCRLANATAVSAPNKKHPTQTQLPNKPKVFSSIFSPDFCGKKFWSQKYKNTKMQATGLVVECQWDPNFAS